MGIAVFDIGKTNKKFFVFNEDYQIVDEETQVFEETVDEDGFPCDDLMALKKWVREKLEGKLNDPALDIKAVNFSTYGASFVHLDEVGKPITPLYNYLKPFPTELEDPFYSRYGGKEDFAATTASPILGNLNSGLQLYRLKKQQPGLFDKIKSSLHLPQYMSFLVHGRLYSDITSIGCHTALWDFEQNNYHGWVEAEGVAEKLCPLFPATDVIEVRLENKQLKCGVGLHDSSAAFIPYMQIIKEPFLLLSTGTWCISMNAFNTNPLTAEELKQDCLSYLTYEGTAVKASRLFAGNEHEEAVKKLSAHFNVSPAYFKSIPFNPHMLEQDSSVAADEAFQYSENTTVQKAYHELIQHLVKKQIKSTELVLNNTPVRHLYVDGGFARNEIFMHLLARAFPQLEVYAASVSQATAVGAALAIHSAWNTKEKIDHLVAVKRYY